MTPAPTVRPPSRIAKRRPSSIATGVIRSSVWVGRDGTVKKHWARVPDAAKHPAKVLEALTDED